MNLNFFKNKQKSEVLNEVVMKEYPKLLTVQSFMVGGLVSYEDTGDGVFLLKKETLDRMMPTIEGRPVILGHKTITLDNLEDNAVGYVTKGWFNTETGQFDCEILVKDSDVYEDIKNGNNKVSSAYQVTKLGDGGKYLGQDYEAEILDGTFTHLAIVDNPRYPDAKILINSLNGEQEMGLFNLKNNDAIEITAEDTVEYMGKTYSIGELVNSYVLHNEDAKDEEAKNEEEEAKNEEEEKKNTGNCKRNEDKDKDNEDEDEKKNEDSDDELVEKVTKIVKRILAEKEDEEKEEEKKNKRNEDKDKDNEDEKEEDKKENRNALRLKNSYYNPRSNVSNISTRADRIKMSNIKYGI